MTYRRPTGVDRNLMSTPQEGGRGGRAAHRRSRRLRDPNFARGSMHISLRVTPTSSLPSTTQPSGTSRGRARGKRRGRELGRTSNDHSNHQRAGRRSGRTNAPVSRRRPLSSEYDGVPQAKRNHEEKEIVKKVPVSEIRKAVENRGRDEKTEEQMTIESSRLLLIQNRRRSKGPSWSKAAKPNTTPSPTQPRHPTTGIPSEQSPTDPNHAPTA